jgi:NAD(P)H-hydrate epimerase
VLPPACDRTGERSWRTSGSPAGVPSLVAVGAARPPRATRRGAGRAQGATSGTCWRVAGSLGKTRSRVLCGTAALRAGAGLVTVAHRRARRSRSSAARAELMTEPLRREARCGACLELAGGCDAAVLGPGWGAEGARAGASSFVAAARSRWSCDADGLNALAPLATTLARRRSRRC